MKLLTTIVLALGMAGGIGSQQNKQFSGGWIDSKKECSIGSNNLGWEIVPYREDAISHRWASELVKEKRTDGTEWVLNLPSIVRQTKDCNTCVDNGGGMLLCTAMMCSPKKQHEGWVLDFCLEHGETRVVAK